MRGMQEVVSAVQSDSGVCLSSLQSGLRAAELQQGDAESAAQEKVAGFR